MTQVYKPGLGNETVLQVDATAGNETVALPASFAPGRKFTIRRVDSSANTVTVTVASGQSLDGTVDGTFTVPVDTDGWLSPSDPGLWQSFGFRAAAVTVDSDGSLVVNGTTVELGTDADIALKAPLASPALTGSPTAPTPTVGDNDTSIATTAFVQTAAAGAAAGLAIVFGG